jgi:hypothetical protein
MMGVLSKEDIYVIQITHGTTCQKRIEKIIRIVGNRSLHPLWHFSLSLLTRCPQPVGELL